MKLTTAQLDYIEDKARKANLRAGDRWHTIHRIAKFYGAPDVAAHVATMAPAATLALVAELRELRATVEKVHALHVKSSLRDECLTCTDEYSDPASWPCDTIQVLGDPS